MPDHSIWSNYFRSVSWLADSFLGLFPDPLQLGAGVAGPGRPTSARTQRPLSGNVYLKKTVKNGWVACSVHEEEEEWGEEGEEDEWEEDEVGCAWGSETLLDGLLQSKKLMNSKQVSRPGQPAHCNGACRDDDCLAC